MQRACGQKKVLHLCDLGVVVDGGIIGDENIKLVFLTHAHTHMV